MPAPNSVADLAQRASALLERAYEHDRHHLVWARLANWDDKDELLNWEALVANSSPTVWTTQLNTLTEQQRAGFADALAAATELLPAEQDGDPC